MYDVLQETKASADALIEEYAAMYKEALDENDLSDRIARAEQAIKLIKGKKSKLLEYNVQGKIDDSDFLAMTSSLNEELKEQESLLAELIQQRDSSDEFASHIKSLRDVLIATENEIKDGVIDKTFINKYIDKIYVTPVSETEMRLEIKIFTGETTEKYFQKLCSRTGHTSKMMKPHDEVYNSSGYRFALLDGSMNNVGFRFFGIDGLDFYDGVLTNFRLTDVNFCNAFLFDT